jgi:hypothetical protein
MSLIKKECKDVEACTKYGYPEGQLYTVQPKAWMKQDHMLDSVNCVWEPYTKGSLCDGQDTYLLMDEFSVHSMRSVCNIINECGTEVEFTPGGYTGCLQILDKWVNTPFKGYLQDEFERWMMSNGSRHKPMRAEVAQWIAIAWSKVTRETIFNTWNSFEHKVGDHDNEYSDRSSVVDIANQPDEGLEDDEPGDDFLLEEAEPLFHGSNMNEVENGEPLFVLELTAEQRAAANIFHMSFTNGVTEV